MSAVLKTRVSPRIRSRARGRAQASFQGLSGSARPSVEQTATNVVSPLPLTKVPYLQPVPSPAKPSRAVQWLGALNTVVSVLTGCLVFTSLGAYGYTVYIDRQLSQASGHLEKLQRSEQQLTAVNEVLKNHLAEQAKRPNTGLRPPQPTNVIFLKPAPPRPLTQGTAAPKPAAPSASSGPLEPLGY